MKHNDENNLCIVNRSFNILCGSKLIEATAQIKAIVEDARFNILCGSKLIEADVAPLTDMELISFQYPLRIEAD